MSRYLYYFSKKMGALCLMIALMLSSCSSPQIKYTTCNSYDELLQLQDTHVPEVIRITDPGIPENPTHHGFFFYNCSAYDGLQFDPNGRYMLGLKVTIEGRLVQPTDTAYVGIIDRQDNYKWTEVGTSTAWNWQQGCRLQWIPGASEEFYWNDRSDDGKSLVCRIYNMRTSETRTLSRPVYTVSPDGITGLTHDFERMIHRGTAYVGIEDKYADEWAPQGTGIFKINIKTGETENIISIAKMAEIIFGKELPSDPKAILYFFREGFNVSGSRFIAFVKDVRGNKSPVTYGYSMTPDGEDIRFLYMEPSHHYWVDDETILDWGRVHPNPETKQETSGYYIFKDDDSGEPKEMLWEAGSNGHDSYHPNGDWILTDTYNLNGYQYLYMYHLPTKTFVLLGKFEFWFKGVWYREHAGTFRVDLHPRFSPDGKIVSFDSTHEGLGRQIYVMDVSHIIENPPKGDKH
jgi:hypothetical protein